MFQNIILFGAPGSGKGTQSARITKKYNLAEITPGNLLRECIKDPQNKFYNAVKSKMDAGELVDVKIIEQIITSAFDGVLSNSAFKGVVFDGFPRSLEQNNFLQSMLAKTGHKLSKAILLDVDVNLLVDRIVNRFTCSKCGEVYNRKTKLPKTLDVCDVCGSASFSQRSDDTEEVIVNRVKVFNNSCKDVIDLYKKIGILHVINGSGEIDEVSKEIDKILFS